MRYEGGEWGRPTVKMIEYKESDTLGPEDCPSCRWMTSAPCHA